MQYRVPQNVQREDTIVGPLTLKQMIILGIGGGLAYAVYVSLAETYFMEIWLPPVALLSVITLAFAFLKIHNLSFPVFLLKFIEYHVLSKKRIWLHGADTFVSMPFASPRKPVPKKGPSAQEVKGQNLSEIIQHLDRHGRADAANPKVDKKTNDK